MHNFQFFVHRTSGIIQDINTTLNPCAGGFYSIVDAVKWGKIIQDKYNFTAIYDASGKLHTILPRN